MTAPISDGAAQPAAVRFALVAVDGVEYAVDAAWVRRSLPAPKPLPAAFPHRGADFRVIDLRQLFGLPAGPDLPSDPDVAPGSGAALPAAAGPGPERLMLLVEQPPAGDGAGEGASRVALVVDDLLGIEALDPGAAQLLPAVYRGPERSWFRGLVPRASGRVTVLLRPAGLSPTAAASEPPQTPLAERRPGGNGC